MNSTKQIYSWLVKHDELTFVACNELELMRQLETMGVEVWNINYDINYNTDDKVICKDAIFDDV